MNGKRLWCSLLALCGLLAASPGEAALIAHWTFDSTADPWHDSVGGNHGTAIGNPGQMVGAIGDNALQLDGSTNYLNVGSGAAFDTQSYTVSAWLQPTTTSGWRTAVGSWKCRQTTPTGIMCWRLLTQKPGRRAFGSTAS